MSHSVETYMPLVVEKYLGDTTHLTTLQHGAYLLLLLHYWRRGGALPDNDARLAATAKLSLAEWKKHRAVLAEFFVIGNGVWMQKRAEKELARARKKSEAAAKSANARWEKDADSMRTHSDRTASAMQADMRERCGSDAPLSKNTSDANASSVCDPPAGKRRLPSNWSPNDKHRQKCAENGVDCDLEAEKMRAWADSGGERKANWDAAFHNWILTEVKRNGGRKQQHAGRTAGEARFDDFMSAAAASARDAGGGRAARPDFEGSEGDDYGGATVVALAAARG